MALFLMSKHLTGCLDYCPFRPVLVWKSMLLMSSEPTKPKSDTPVTDTPEYTAKMDKAKVVQAEVCSVHAETGRRFPHLCLIKEISIHRWTAQLFMAFIDILTPLLYRTVPKGILSGEDLCSLKACSKVLDSNINLDDAHHLFQQSERNNVDSEINDVPRLSKRNDSKWVLSDIACDICLGQMLVGPFNHEHTICFSCGDVDELDNMQGIFQLNNVDRQTLPIACRLTQASKYDISTLVDRRSVMGRCLLRFGEAKFRKMYVEYQQRMQSLRKPDGPVLLRLRSNTLLTEQEWYEQNRVTNIRVKKKSYTVARKADLKRCLVRCGLDFRNDSRLCRAYVKNTFTKKDEVVSMMKEMNWFMTKTTYAEVVQRIYLDSRRSQKERPLSLQKAIKDSLLAKRIVLRNIDDADKKKLALCRSQETSNLCLIKIKFKSMNRCKSNCL